MAPILLWQRGGEQELGLGCNSPFPSAPSRSRWGTVSWRTTVPPRRSCVSAARTSACWGAKSSGTGRGWDGALRPLVSVSRSASPRRALLNWRTKLRRFLAKKLKEQAKELDIK